LVVVFPCVAHQSEPSRYVVGMKTIQGSRKHEVDGRILGRTAARTRKKDAATPARRPASPDSGSCSLLVLLVPFVFFVLVWEQEGQKGQKGQKRRQVKGEL
jgi:hypothetical protein